MAPIWQTEQTEVTRLRIKTSHLDPLTAQRQIADALNSVSLHPAGLPASAILCIRTLRDPQPGLLRLPGNQRHTRAWGQAVHQAIDQLVHRAARPVHGAVPANAEAVLFADRSELLACLALDWCAGEVSTRWWWQSLLRHQDVTRAVIAAWLQTPEHIPAALHHLASQHQAASFAQKLSDAEACELALAVTRTFGLRELHTLIQDSLTMSASYPSPENETSVTPERWRQNFSAPPWSAHVNEVGLQALSLHRQLLIGLGILLCCAPRRARSPTLAQAVQRWLAAINQTQLIVSITPNAQGDSGESKSQIEMRLGSIRDTSLAPQPVHSLNERDLRQSPLSQRAAAPRSGRETRLTGARRPSTATSSVDDTQGFVSAQEALPLHPLTPNEVEGAPESSAVIGAVQPAQVAEGLEINTALGGSLYLINLGLFLGLYGDFTTPLTPGIDLLIWDFIALVAVELLGDEVRADPLWSLLAHLAGRATGESPGADFNPPRHVSLPAWLAELMQTLRPRLRQALGADDENLPGFFHAQARIVTTGMRLDAFFSLAELPVAIRLSGLDRNPGWVPAAGRTIAFHFD